MRRRLSPAAIPRDLLLFAMRTPRTVFEARRVDRCLLCCNPGVMEAGVCEVCYAGLEGEELRMAVRWRSGIEP